MMRFVLREKGEKMASEIIVEFPSPLTDKEKKMIYGYKGEVVRCKDCYYCATEKSFGKVYHYCEAFEQYAEGDLIGVSLEVNPDHFCSWGERRKDAKTD